MKILVISDTHYELDNLSKLLKKYPDMDLYLHAGDSEWSPDELFPFQSVKGNRDYLSSFPKELVFNTPLGNLIMRHILQYSLKFSENLIRYNKMYSIFLEDYYG